MVSGTANVQLQAERDGTLLQYQTNAKISGKLAQIGSRLIDGFANKTAEEFFARLNNILSESVAVTQPVGAVVAEEIHEEQGKENGGRGFRSWFSLGGKRNPT
jgi:hypothetical protein